METVTFQQSTIRGFVQGKAVVCTLRGSPTGLQLAPGSYLLRPAQDNPVYGRVMAIEPLGGVSEAAASIKEATFKEAASMPIKGGWVPGQYDLRPPSQYDLRPPAPGVTKASPALKLSDNAPSALNFRPGTSIARLGAPSGNLAVPPSGNLAVPPSGNLAVPPSGNLAVPPAGNLAVPPSENLAVPAIKFDTAAGQLTQPVVISERSIAGNCLVATAGFSDLIDVVQRAGAITLVVP